MNTFDANMERLINRKLDGELTADEAIELDRELLRNPQLRELLAQYKRIDAAAKCAITASVELPPSRSPNLQLPQSTAAGATHRRRMHWMTYAGAMAACLALVVFWKTPPAHEPNAGLRLTERGTDVSHPSTTSGQPSAGKVTPWQELTGSDVGVFRVSDIAPRRVNRMVDRNLILLPAQNGQLYLLNIDHARQVSIDNAGKKQSAYPDPI